ncbi:DNA repair protein RadA [Clostridium weizhouense]|uniref:DNA repair protein RadA n=1 Tax=Clostridium weizhouense TaxID=2859781 RepID=A0ABS7ANZ0_9CLOT|nr:DNA repair protein RadA [Clostridium weizhouense]MBW6410352.1 DNA repair protein RadA [Clostridium weizhouense]
MAKIKSVYICQQCGYESPKWLGKCPSCSSWNTFNEELKNNDKAISALKVNSIVQNNSPKTITEIQSGEKERYDTGINELNRVLGGGLVKGSLTLISGDPGIGKSTLLLQTANNISLKYGKVLYVSGEESEEQIKIRGDRLGVNSSDLFIVSETNLEAISVYIEQLNPKFVIIDSIQTIFKDNISSAPGSVSQVKECSNTIMRMCKKSNVPFFLVAHVTKQGELAGPRVLEHMVDTVLYFEGERTEEYRILRTMKNRFGTTSEIGVFEMEQEGLIEVFDPSKIFLEDTSFNQEGSVVIGIMEGTRPILVEIQALVTETNAPMPRRTAVGIDNQRLSLILAVLEKKLKLPFYNKDVYVNVVGGFSIDGTAADLGLALALLSSAKSRNFKLEKTLIVGEVGLTGEIRPISSTERLVKEAEKLGFRNVIIPERNKEKVKTDSINVIGVGHLKEVISKIF